MTEASFIVPEITREIFERALPEIEKLTDDGNETENQMADNSVTNSGKIKFEKWRSTEYIPSSSEPSMSTTSASLPRLPTSETRIEQRSEANMINASSSNPSAFPSNTFENTNPGVNLVGNFISDPIISHYTVEYLLAINSMGSLTGGQFDSMSAPLYQVNESQTESYGGSSTSGTISNTTGSEQSSYSETMETVDSMSEQELNQQYYQLFHAIIRKEFNFHDDDSPIY